MRVRTEGPRRRGAHNGAKTPSTYHCVVTIPGRRFHGSAAETNRGREKASPRRYLLPPTTTTHSAHRWLASILVYLSVKSVKKRCSHSFLHPRGASAGKQNRVCSHARACVCVLQFGPVKTSSKHTLKLICRGRSIRQTRH